MITTALTVALAVLGSESAAGKDVPFGSEYSVHWVEDSIWGHCDMNLEVTERAKGTVRTACRWEDGPMYQGERPLTTQEVGDVRTLLKSAGLFEGEFAGVDRRGLDAPLVTIQVWDAEQTALLVVSGNASFDSGPRAALVKKLTGMLKSTDRRPQR